MWRDLVLFLLSFCMFFFFIFRSKCSCIYFKGSQHFWAKPLFFFIAYCTHSVYSFYELSCEKCIQSAKINYLVKMETNNFFLSEKQTKCVTWHSNACQKRTNVNVNENKVIDWFARVSWHRYKKKYMVENVET